MPWSCSGAAVFDAHFGSTTALDAMPLDLAPHGVLGVEVVRGDVAVVQAQRDVHGPCSRRWAAVQAGLHKLQVVEVQQR